MHFIFLMLIQFLQFSGDKTLVKEIPNTKLLVSLNHNNDKRVNRANMAIFDLSRKSARKIYSFEEVCGGNSQSNCTYHKSNKFHYENK